MRVTVLATVLLLPLLARAADPLPSLEDLQKSLADKDWPALLKGSARVLQLRGPATAGFHRTTVWQLKAEALLHSGQTSAAAAAFASSAAEKDATDEEKDLSLATAMVLKRSNGTTFKPPISVANRAPEPIDITDAGSRKDAMAALLAGELSDLGPATEKLKETLAPTPLTTAAKKLTDLQPLERTTEKSTEKIDALQQTLGKNFAAAIGDWSTRTGRRLDELARLSDQLITTRYTDAKGQLHTRQGPRGLQPQEQTEVRGLAGDAKGYAQAEEQIAAAMNEAGKAEIKKSQPIIQATFDQAQIVLRAAALVH